MLSDSGKKNKKRDVPHCGCSRAQTAESIQPTERRASNGEVEGGRGHGGQLQRGTKAARTGKMCVCHTVVVTWDEILRVLGGVVARGKETKEWERTACQKWRGKVHRRELLEPVALTSWMTRASCAPSVKLTSWIKQTLFRHYLVSLRPLWE